MCLAFKYSVFRDFIFVYGGFIAITEYLGERYLLEQKICERLYQVTSNARSGRLRAYANL